MILRWLDSDDFAERFSEEYPLTNRLRHLTNEPISGYINRLFPIKFALRVFASMTLSECYDLEDERYDELADLVDLSDLRERCYSTAKYAKESLLGFGSKD